MGRTDAWSLQMPEPLPVMPEAANTANSNAGSAAAQIAEMLGRPAAPSAEASDTVQPKTALVQCPACKASLSGVEQKFEKCLSCGKSFAGGGSISVSVGI